MPLCSHTESVQKRLGTNKQEVKYQAEVGVPGEQALGCYVSNGQTIQWSDGWHDPAAGVPIAEYSTWFDFGERRLAS